MQFNKKTYTFKEYLKIMILSAKSIRTLIRSGKDKLLSRKFEERINLAVTEVNGCAVCSYAHTKIALKSGISEEEISKILNGSTDGIPESEAAAVFFAQHYADTKGNPDIETWKRLVDIYGVKKASAILATIRIIMFGNAYGIAYSDFKSRLNGKSNTNSRLINELGILSGVILFLPIIIFGFFNKTTPGIKKN
jgi:AhpD family alkylhydroperoxidase